MTFDSRIVLVTLYLVLMSSLAQASEGMDTLSAQPQRPLQKSICLLFAGYTPKGPPALWNLWPHSPVVVSMGRSKRFRLDPDRPRISGSWQSLSAPAVYRDEQGARYYLIQQKKGPEIRSPLSIVDDFLNFGANLGIYRVGIRRLLFPETEKLNEALAGDSNFRLRFADYGIPTQHDLSWLFGEPFSQRYKIDPEDYFTALRSGIILWPADSEAWFEARLGRILGYGLLGQHIIHETFMGKVAFIDAVEKMLAEKSVKIAFIETLIHQSKRALAQLHIEAASLIHPGSSRRSFEESTANAIVALAGDEAPRLVETARPLHFYCEQHWQKLYWKPVATLKELAMLIRAHLRAGVREENLRREMLATVDDLEQFYTKPLLYEDQVNLLAHGYYERVAGLSTNR